MGITTRVAGSMVALALSAASCSSAGTTATDTTHPSSTSAVALSVTTTLPSDPPPSSANTAAASATASFDVEEVAGVLGISTLVVEIDGVIHAVSDSMLTSFMLPDDAQSWSDGTFLFWIADWDDDQPITTITDLDGTPRCETTGYVWSAEVVEGVVVATVQEPPPEIETEGPIDVPFFTVDCATGDRTPADSQLTYGFDGETTFILRVGDRRFDGQGDAEGNADITNEEGISINGDDYAGDHQFSPDGSSVVYGDMATLASPLLSSRLVARDTIVGTEQWTADLPSPYRRLHHSGERVIVGLADEMSIMDGSQLVESIRVLDARTGEVLAEADLGVHLLHAG